IDIAIRQIANGNLAELATIILSPLFTAANGYLGFAIIFGFIAFFWFIGVHGPSVVGPAVIAIMYNNQVENLRLFREGQHAHIALTQSTQDFVALIGGTGATFLVPYIFIFLCKSKELKAVGKASFIPTTFAVNEPLLFGAPIILNPVFMIPFIVTPILNSWVLKFFVENLGMNGFMHFLPWPTPGPIGIYMASNFAPLSLLLIVVIMILDFMIWMPFIKAYDRIKVSEERGTIECQNIVQPQSNAESNENSQLETTDTIVQYDIKDHVNVLVVCAGGGTSGILANSLNKAAKEQNIHLNATARAYGQDMDLIKDMNIVILAPQMDSMKNEMKKYTDQHNALLMTTTGKEYIALTRDGEAAIEKIYKLLSEEK
ncbi:lactose/cellobiose PTS transporter subunit IIB, partial [Mammaliicoccus sciuri]